MSATVGATRGPAVAWVSLAALSLVLLVIWWQPLIGRGPGGVATWVPFVLPLIFAARLLISGSVGSTLTGFALGISVAGATGRGVVFTLLAIGAIALDLLSVRLAVRHVLAAGVGFALGLLMLGVVLYVAGPS